MDLYPSLKPLTTEKPPADRQRREQPAGMISKAVYERRRFTAAFKKARP